jgi:hypothetical protein
MRNGLDVALVHTDLFTLDSALDILTQAQALVYLLQHDMVAAATAAVEAGKPNPLRDSFSQVTLMSLAYTGLDLILDTLTTRMEDLLGPVTDAVEGVGPTTPRIELKNVSRLSSKEIADEVDAFFRGQGRGGRLE